LKKKKEGKHKKEKERKEEGSMGEEYSFLLNWG
jgi:hypothetical protein